MLNSNHVAECILGPIAIIQLKTNKASIQPIIPLTIKAVASALPANYMMLVA